MKHKDYKENAFIIRSGEMQIAYDYICESLYCTLPYNQEELDQSSVEKFYFHSTCFVFFQNKIRFGNEN